MTNNNLSEPSNLVQVLISSFNLLSSQPKLFIPKILSTGLSALWFIGFLSGSGNSVQYLAVFPLLILLGVMVSVMLAGMVKNKKSDKILHQALATARNNIGKIVSASVWMLLVLFLVSLPASIGMYYYLQTQTLMLPAVLIGISLIIMFGLSFAIYFLPITLLENGGLLDGVRQSGSAAVSNSKEVTILTLLSFALISITFVSQGMLEKAGYIGFFLGRMVSAVVTTYLFVVSPEYYLKDN
jgi:hypothetical protein